MGQSARDVGIMHQHMRIARERRVNVKWINLVCEAIEHAQRIASPERMLDGTTKCVDVGIVQNIMANPEHALVDQRTLSQVKNILIEFIVEDTSGGKPLDCANSFLKRISQSPCEVDTCS